MEIRNLYLKSIIDKVENFIKRLRWEAFKIQVTITYKNDLYDIICNTEFKTEQNNFQKDLMLDFKKKQ